jgi:dihydropteroate synthase
MIPKLKLMGILNLTPDSFSDGDPSAKPKDFVARAFDLIEQGADVLDIGGESTRPGSQAISTTEEVTRVVSFLKNFRKTHPNFPISLDSKKYEVALAARPYGIQYINDVSFLQDIRLAQLAKEEGYFYILMHTRGNHDDMLKQTHYADGFFPTLKKEIKAKFQTLQSIEFPFEKLILDPGFGFAKTPEHCVSLMENLEFWRGFEAPLLIGLSRKRFLEKYVGKSKDQDRDELSAKFSCQAFQKGFYMARVHNVACTKKEFENSILQSDKEDSE